MAHNHVEQYPALNQKLQTARQNADTPQVCLALADLGMALFQRRRYETGLQHFEEAIELSAALPDIELQVHCLNLKMLALQHVPRLPDAYQVAEEILQLGRARQKPDIQCNALTSQGQIMLESGEPVIAIERLQAAQEIAQQLGEKRLLMNVLGVMGHASLAVAAADQAGVYFRRAQSLAEELDDPAASIGFEGNTAIVLIWQGRHPEALPALERVRAFAEEADNQTAEIQALRHLVKTHAHLKNQAEIINYTQRGLTLADPDDAATRFFFLSAQIPALYQEGRLAESKEALTDATQMMQGIKGDQNRLDSWLVLCELYALLELPNTADIYLTALDQAISLNRQKEQARLLSRLGELITDGRRLMYALETRLPQLTESNILAERSMLHSLIKICIDAGDFEKAIAYTQRALMLAERADEQPLADWYRMTLTDALFKARRYADVVAAINTELNDHPVTIDKARELYLRQMQSDACIELNDFEAAIHTLEIALTLSDQTEQPQSKARILGRLGSVYAERGDLERANLYMINAIEEARTCNDLETAGELLCILALNYQDLGQADRALDSCEEAIGIFQDKESDTLIATALSLKQELQPA
ncbi:MAG: tetratricopeptide repeat protein [Caldilineaceae bacterium]|nr:tetratricopeptide repeat protein [Caldilineaceae bacterium]